METVIVGHLEWQKTVSSTRFTFKEAEEYAKGSSDGWRLPTRPELMEIINRKYQNPSIDQSLFPNTPVALFWTSTVWEGNVSYRWDGNFSDGTMWGHRVDSKNRVRLVRSKRT